MQARAKRDAERGRPGRRRCFRPWPPGALGGQRTEGRASPPQGLARVAWAHPATGPCAVPAGSRMGEAVPPRRRQAEALWARGGAGSHQFLGRPRPREEEEVVEVALGRADSAATERPSPKFKEGEKQRWRGGKV